MECMLDQNELMVYFSYNTPIQMAAPSKFLKIEVVINRKLWRY